MANVDAHVISFNARAAVTTLNKSIGLLKSGEHMQCPGFSIGINIDTNFLANAADEMHKALEKVPPEITIKFYR